ncbi:hypothetical protein AAOGI_06880 [Agarivorans albus]
MRVFLDSNFETRSTIDRFTLGDLPTNDTKNLDAALILRQQYTSPAGLAKPEDNRLVQRRKSRTPTENASASARKPHFFFDSHKAKEIHRLEQHFIGENDKRPLKTTWVDKHVCTRAPKANPRFINKQTGEIYATNNPKARIYHRAWANQYRVRVEAQTSCSEPPASNEGERTTKELNSRAASKIMDAGAYVQVAKGGFTTFLTLTFDDDARARIISGESTIGAEVSRFFSAAKKMYQRGWVCEERILDTRGGIDSISASAVPAETKCKGDFDYIWCAEMPENKKGEPNPHCHVLLRWSVPYVFFAQWAERLEKLWGLGFAKLERIRNAEAASGYLLKALGYITKGSKKDQGEIRGNRYNISAGARAPAWECIASFEAENMCAIINELKDRWHLEHQPIRQQLKANQKELKQKTAIYMKAKFSSKPESNKVAENLKKRIAKLDEQIKQGYQALKAKGARADNYHITINGKEKLSQFLHWAMEKRGWLPELNKTKPLSLTEISLIKRARIAWRNAADWGRWAWSICQDAASKPEPDTNLINFIEYESLGGGNNEQFA